MRSPVDDDAAPPPPRWRTLLPALSRPARVVLGLAVVAGAFAWALPSFASYRDVGRELSHLRTGPATILVVLAVINLVSPALVHRSSVPGLALRRAVLADWVTSAITNTIPAGSALAVGMTWRMYRSWGIERQAIARSVVLTGVWDNLVKLGTPLLALAWLSTERPVGPGLVQATLVACLLFAAMLVLGTVVLAGPAVSNRIGALLDRLPAIGDGWGDRLGRFRIDTVDLLRSRWTALTGWTVAGHAVYFLLLLACLRAVGVDGSRLSPAAVLAAFTFGRLVTAIPITPGGLGVLEVGLTSALAAVGGGPEAALVAAVLVFRFCSFVVPIPLGAGGWLLWSNRRTGDDAHPPSADVAGRPAGAL